MGTDDRQKILSGIERSLALKTRVQHEKRDQHEPAPLEWVPGTTPWDESRKEIESLGDRLYVASRLGDLQRILADIVKKHAVSLAVRWDHTLLEKLKIDALLGECGVEVRIPSREKEWKERSAAAQLGVTAVDAFVMESGTLVSRSTKGWGRLISLLPPVHLAIVRSDQRLRKLSVLPLLIKRWAGAGRGLPSAVTLVTGHSRTADIELVLVSGVHGPGMLYVVGLDATFPAERLS